MYISDNDLLHANTPCVEKLIRKSSLPIRGHVHEFPIILHV